MKNFLTGMISLLLVLAACEPVLTGAEGTRQALITFFDHLDQGELPIYTP